MNKILIGTLLLFISLTLSSCKEGVTGGNIIQSFQGLDTYQVLSPTAVKLDWLQQDKYSEYQVFELGQSDPIEVSIFDTYTVTGLTADTEYVFKVIAIDGDNESYGGDKEVRIRTYPRFSGITAIEKDIDGNIVLSWDFPHSVYRYHIYTNSFSKPTAATTNNWDNAAVTLSANQQSYTFTNLEGSTQFYFQVHAEYRPGEFERPDQEITESTPTSFPDPLFDLPEVTIGSLPFATITPVVNADFLEPNYTSQFFHGVTALSDPLVGQGVVSFLDSNNLGLGKIDNITLKVTYDDGVTNETYVQSGLETYIKGKSPVLDQPVSEDGFTKGAAKLGQAMASGDFNCDGFKDLAMGMPETSIGSLGVSSNYAGAIYVYYSVTEAGVTSLYTDIEPSINPVRPGKDPQIITFSDSAGYERFGFSLSSGGNFNGDKLGGNDCEDLIVGAPYMRTGISNQYRTGAAFVFFGNKNGLSSSQTYSNIQDNIGTCDGLLEDSSCSPVRLWPDYAKWPSEIFPNGYQNVYNEGPGSVGWQHTTIQFGYALNFIGDFNADGYDDIAVGAPYAEYDGEVHVGAPGEKAYIQNVGFVAIYFGSKYGLGYDEVDSTETTKRFPFVKVFPPIPHENMYFGMSISNGADVNGNHRILMSDGKYHGGSDFVVGAPGFYYPNPTKLPSTYNAQTPVDGGWTDNYTSGTSFYGFPQNDPAQVTGAAFLYYGRDAATRPLVEETPSSHSFWNCNSRSLGSKENHYSCLTSASDSRILFPRNNESQDFGSSVAILGAPSFYDDNSTLQVPAIDSNGDGYGEIVVAASRGKPQGSSLTSSGVLWQYFGNNQKYYEHNYAGQGVTTAADQYLLGASTCANFSSNIANDPDNRLNCRPTLLQSNSFRGGARMGYSNETITVGQITNDGLLDLAIGAPYDNANGTSAGAVLLFTSDSTRGLTSNYKKLYSTAGGDDTEIGYSVAIGNFDGDLNGSSEDYNDVAAGGPGDDTFRAGSGSTHLFLSNGYHIASFKSDSDKQIYDNLGSPQQLGYQRASIVGDVNGDGYDDAAAHSVRYNSQGGIIYDGIIFFGSEEHGLVTSSLCLENPGDFVTDSDPAHCYPRASRDTSVVREGIILPQLIPKFETQSNYWADYARPAGDVNGDGFADVLFFSRESRYELFFGSSAGVISTDQPQWIPSSGNPQIVTENFDQVYGETSVNSPISRWADNRDMIKHGDFNNDGFSDIVITNPYGSSPTLPFAWDCTNPVPDPDDAKTQAECNDGAAVEYHGYALLIYGSSNGLQTPSLDTANFSYGTDISFSNAATYLDIYGTESGTDPCDTNNVCKPTLIRNPVFPGLPGFANLEYGFQRLSHRFSMSSAVLDTDNNGYDDLFLGAPNFEDLGCYVNPDADSTPLNYGRIYIFKGTNKGLVAASAESYFEANIASACPSTNDTALTSTTVRALMPTRVESPATTVTERKGREFAYNMTEAGDVNGDGFEDLLVSAPYEDSSDTANAGAMYLYYGPICNTDNNTTYSDVFAQDTANLNKQLTVGDVSGSVTFDSTCNVSAGKLPWQKFYVKGAAGTSDLYAGASIQSNRKGLADFNGDGYDDVVIGNPYWDDDFNGVSNIGRGVIYFGSDQGLFTEDFPSVNVVTNSDGFLRPYSLQSPTAQAASYFFANLFSMGDYNNDGTADLLVPSYWHDGLGDNRGINVGVFFIFY